MREVQLLLVVDNLAPGLLMAQGEPLQPAMPYPAAIRGRRSRWEA